MSDESYRLWSDRHNRANTDFEHLAWQQEKELRSLRSLRSQLDVDAERIEGVAEMRKQIQELSGALERCKVAALRHVDDQDYATKILNLKEPSAIADFVVEFMDM